MSLNDFLEKRMFRVVKRQAMMPHGLSDIYRDPKSDVLIEIVKENMTIREARRLKNELNDSDSRSIMSGFYYCFEKMPVSE